MALVWALIVLMTVWIGILITISGQVIANQMKCSVLFPTIWNGFDAFAARYDALLVLICCTGV